MTPFRQLSEEMKEDHLNGTLVGAAAESNSVFIVNEAFQDITNESGASLSVAAQPKLKRSSTSDNNIKTSKEDVSSSRSSFDNNAPIEKRLIYGLADTPPLHYLLIFALQQSSLAISTPLSTAAVVAQAVCAQDEPALKIKILSSTMLMMGLATLTITTFGVRLPIFQGPSLSYIIPMVVMMSLPDFKCPDTFRMQDPTTNTSVLMAIMGNNTAVRNEEVAIARINAYAGSLMIAGAVHCLVGVTGCVGILGRFVGPITIIPVVLLFGIYIHTFVVSFAETNWTAAALTAVTCLVLSLYLGHCMTPIPLWSKKRGFHVAWQPVHQLFSILISIIVGWLVSFIMTEAGALSSDPTHPEFKARTDSRLDIIRDTDWFILPYPGQFGVPSFSTAALVSFLVSTVLSILDSVGDYCACAKIAGAPTPPKYALNRGIAVEGLMTFLSGSLGIGHSTVSYGENIGAMSLCKMASRSVFQAAGLIYIVAAFFGKFGAFFSTVPDSVIGGSQIVTFGILIGVILSYLQLIDLNSMRNISIIGISLFLGLMLPHWCKIHRGSPISGNADVDRILRLFLSNPSFVGAFVACFMDNTVPGTAAERGIVRHSENNDASAEARNAGEANRGNPAVVHGQEVYRLPWLPDKFRKSKFARIVPLFDISNSQ